MNDNLVQRCLDGDREAFSLLIEEYKGYVFAIILRFIQDQEMVRDIAQEVFLQVYQSLNSYQPQNFKGWIGKITVNKTIDYKRKCKTFELKLEEASLYQEHEKIGEPERLWLEKEKENQVQEVLQQLPLLYREMIYKHYYQGKSYQEIASEEGISKKTVESRLYRARNIFRQKWRDLNK